MTWEQYIYGPKGLRTLRQWAREAVRYGFRDEIAQPSNVCEVLEEVAALLQPRVQHLGWRVERAYVGSSHNSQRLCWARGESEYHEGLPGPDDDPDLYAAIAPVLDNAMPTATWPAEFREMHPVDYWRERL